MVVVSDSEKESQSRSAWHFHFFFLPRQQKTAPLDEKSSFEVCRKQP